VSDENYPIDRTPSLWDRIFRGRSSSHRRAIANAGVHAAQCAAALGEAARLIDTVASDRREAEGLALALQIRDLAEGMMACADHIEVEFRRG
jgi:hypothetical protein